ncbi:MAG: nucleotidyltransferase domain-containing protein [Promethearchaeia archaeon]
MKSELKTKIKQDLQELGDKYEVVVYGSHISGGTRPNSDIDIALITRVHDEQKNIKIWKNIISYNLQPYDIKIFELLPLRIKMSIIHDYEVIFGELLEISEYFYKYRKIWEDCKHRIFANQFQSIQAKQEQRKKYLARHNK